MSTVAEEDKKNETEEAPKPQKSYLLKSAVRGRTNRAQRYVQPGRQPFVQRLAGGNIVVRRARPARITEAALKANLVEIQKAVANHQLVVTTLDGQLLNLDTFEVAKQAAAAPLPNPPLDSAKNDKNENIGYDVPPTPEGTTANAEVPEHLRDHFIPTATEEVVAASEVVEESTPKEPEPKHEHPKGKHHKGKR